MTRTGYNRPGDNIIANATMTVTVGATLTKFPIANIRNLLPYFPVKFSGVRARIVFDFGVAVTIHLVALIHHNLKAGLNARWQGNATNTWGGPTLDAPFTIAAADSERYRLNSFLDLSAAPVTSFRYWSLDLNEEDNDLNLILGELWLGAVVRELDQDYMWGYQPADQRPGRSEFPVAGGPKWVYPALGRQRLLTGETQTRDVGHLAIREWNRACGGTDQPTIIIPDQTINDAWLVHWNIDYFARVDFIDDSALPLSFTEVARGPAWP